jgi:hypothetical protein
MSEGFRGGFGRWWTGGVGQIKEGMAAPAAGRSWLPSERRRQGIVLCLEEEDPRKKNKKVGHSQQRLDACSTSLRHLKMHCIGTPFENVV